MLWQIFNNFLHVGQYNQVKKYISVWEIPYSNTILRCNSVTYFELYKQILYLRENTNVFESF